MGRNTEHTGNDPNLWQTKRMIPPHLALALTLLGTTSAPLLAGGRLYFTEDRNTDGLYLLDLSNASPMHLGASSTNPFQGFGLAPTDDPDILLGSEAFDLVSINADGSGATFLSDASANGIAYDPTSSLHYLSSTNTIVTYDMQTGFWSQIGNCRGNVGGMAYGNSYVYGLLSDDPNEGWIVRYDIANDVWTDIGDTGIDFESAGLAYDPLRNVLYAIGAQDSFLYEIDPATASATVVGDTGISGGGGLAFVIPSPMTPIPMLLSLASVAPLRRRR